MSCLSILYQCRILYRNTPIEQYHGGQTAVLPHASSSTAQLVSYAHALSKAVFRFGFRYQKVSVLLAKLVGKIISSTYSQMGQTINLDYC